MDEQDYRKIIYELESTVKTMIRTEFFLGIAIVVNSAFDLLRVIKG